MPNKAIAVIAASNFKNEPGNENAMAIQNALKANGYDAVLVHQNCLDEANSTYYKDVNAWERYDGIVVAGRLFESWPTIDLVRSGRPIILTEMGYVDELALGVQPLEIKRSQEFKLMDRTHPIVEGSELGSFLLPAPLEYCSVDTGKHHVDVLVRDRDDNPVFVAHKTRELVYFGWFGIAGAAEDSILFKWLVNAANWAF